MECKFGHTPFIIRHTILMLTFHVLFPPVLVLLLNPPSVMPSAFPPPVSAFGATGTAVSEACLAVPFCHAHNPQAYKNGLFSGAIVLAPLGAKGLSAAGCAMLSGGAKGSLAEVRGANGSGADERGANGSCVGALGANGSSTSEEERDRCGELNLSQRGKGVEVM